MHSASLESSTTWPLLSAHMFFSTKATPLTIAVTLPRAKPTRVLLDPTMDTFFIISSQRVLDAELLGVLAQAGHIRARSQARSRVDSWCRASLKCA